MTEQALTLIIEDPINGVLKVTYPKVRQAHTRFTVLDPHRESSEIGVDFSFRVSAEPETGISHLEFKLGELAPDILPNFTIVQTPDEEMYVRVPDEGDLVWKGLNHLNKWYSEKWLAHDELVKETFTIISMPVKAEEAMYS